MIRISSELEKARQEIERKTLDFIERGGKVEKLETCERFITEDNLQQMLYRGRVDRRGSR